MRTRPTSITVVAWILILMGGISLITMTLMISTGMIDKFTVDNPAARELMNKSPIPVPVQYAMTYVTLLIELVSGIAILKGQNWGRWLYVVGTVFLFRPKANQYFSDQESAHDTQSA